jgi:hypothetical protein
MRRAVLALVVLPLALAACSGTEARVARTLTPAASVRQAATKTADATSMHVTVDASGGSGILAGRVTGSGDFDIANQRGSFELQLSRLGTIDAVIDGTRAYVKAPFLSVFLPTGKPWLKLEGRRASGLNGLPQNPKQALARLKQFVNVKEVGDETIDGVSTTHYHGTARRGQGTFDVWIGKDDGYVRRIQANGNGGSGVVNFSDFGEPVSTTVPPASQTATMGSGNFGRFFKLG